MTPTQEFVHAVAMSLPPSDFGSGHAVNAMAAAIDARYGPMLEALEGCLHFDDGFVRSGVIGEELTKWRDAARAAIARAGATS